MDSLLVRTVAQAFQAFLPIAICATWLRASRRHTATTGLRWGVIAACPATLIAGYAFQHAVRQARWEALLATITTGLAVWFLAIVHRAVEPKVSGAIAEPTALATFAMAVATTVVIVRQTMEIYVVLAAAAFDLQSGASVGVIISGTAVGIGVSAAWIVRSRHVTPSAVVNAIRVFAVLFLFQVALYAFHEAAEARVLPWSEVLHAATEPYGPDSRFGEYVSFLLIIGPVLTAAMTVIYRRVGAVISGGIGAAGVLTASLALIALQGWSSGTESVAAAALNSVPAHGTAVLALATPPHVLFRHTRTDADYGKLGVSLLDAPDGLRATAELSCERVSFAGDRGICLTADRAARTTSSAILFDRSLKAVATIPLRGAPSRTRVSRDGRLGATTVFVSEQTAGESHGYAGSKFSTKTILIEMASAKVLGDLEQFATWKDGKRFQAVDFNFWGVTFAKDSNLFYGTLKTAGKTYLVRGDVGRRSFTVLRENVECPSLSPDNRTIVFKKRVNPMGNGWRLYALDVETMIERPLAEETTFVDDQAEWLDNEHVLYAIPRAGSADVFISPIDGTDRPQVFLRDAQSPIIVR